MSPARNRLDLRELGLLPGTRTSRDFQLGVDPVILGGATVEIVVADPGATLTVPWRPARNAAPALANSMTTSQ